MNTLRLAATLTLLSAGSLAAQTVTFTPTGGVPSFAVREPVLRITPGTIVETQTFSHPGDYYDPDKAGPWPGDVGPFYIEGATPDDTLVVRILKLTPNRDIAVSNITPASISAVATDARTRLLNPPLPSRRFVWRLDRARMIGTLDLPNSASKRIELPLAPMLGRVAVAPAGTEVFGGLWPGDFGDFHALQGDGEIAGSGLESTADVTLQFDLIKGQRIRWPRIEDETHIMVAGSVRPLDGALRIAYVELIQWLVDDYGFEMMEAYQVVSQAGTVRVANMVDPNFTIVARFPKAALPPRVRK